MLEDLEASCSPGASALAVAIRASAAFVLLQRAGKDTDEVKGVNESMIIQTIANIQLVAAELQDPDALFQRVLRALRA